MFQRLSQRERIVLVLVTILALSNLQALGMQLLHTARAAGAFWSQRPPEAAFLPLKNALTGGRRVNFISNKKGVHFYRDLCASKNMAAPIPVREGLGPEMQLVIATGYTGEQIKALARANGLHVILEAPGNIHLLEKP